MVLPGVVTARAFAVLMALIIPSAALAHAVVFPKSSTPGAYEKYVLRVPNERDVPTTRVEIHFPAGLRVVSFGDVTGWKLEVLRDTAQRVIGAVWTGVLPKERFVEFPFVAVNPKDSTSLAWPTYQTYEGGERVEWTSPDTASKTPASATTIATTASKSTTASGTSFYLSVIALLLGLTALGVALRPRTVSPMA
ncbi:MAG: YcnI family protein [Gemmatimonadaceae bacterium]